MFQKPWRCTTGCGDSDSLFLNTNELLLIQQRYNRAVKSGGDWLDRLTSLVWTPLVLTYMMRQPLTFLELASQLSRAELWSTSEKRRFLAGVSGTEERGDQGRNVNTHLKTEDVEILKGDDGKLNTGHSVFGKVRMGIMSPDYNQIHCCNKLDSLRNDHFFK